METNTAKQSFACDPVSRELWYVRDRRIRTRSAARRAIELVEQIRSRQELDPDLDDTTLFAAMHTCAYRAARSSRIEPATGDDRRAWAERWRDLREYIVNKHVGLAYMGLSRFDSVDWDEDDRASEAMYALGRAVRRFNPWKGFRFSTYACTAIGRLLRRQGRREINYRQMFPVQNDGSLEGIVDMPNPRNDQTGLFMDRLNQALEQNLGKLTELESTVLTLRFPRDNNRNLTFLEIGQSVGLSKERVRQVQNIALGKLREVLIQDPVLSDEYKTIAQ